VTPAFLDSGRFATGECATLRYFCGGRILYAFPMTVVEDQGERVVLWIPADTPCKRPARKVTLADRARGEWVLTDKPWSDGSATLILFAAGQAHATWLFWDEQRTFTGWYVNLEDPWRRTAIGFDTRDHLLDIAVDPDEAWRWLDESDLETAIRLGLFTAEEASRIRAEGERVIRRWPFPTGWEDWRPEPDWTIPRVPPGWDVVG
jgi:uncharacterized protein